MEIFSHPLFIFSLELLKTWWWLFLPFFLFRPFVFLWLWWRNDVYDRTHGFKVLEVKVPLDAIRPIKAMENVFAGFWQLYDPPNPREKWFEGQYQQGMSVEIISSEGEIHFYLRVPEGSKKIVESALYSQYPDAELIEVDDYTNNLPKDIPNKDWEMWGASYKLRVADPYPIKTYTKFFEVIPEAKEETKVVPMSLAVENLSKIGKGEHLWIQFGLTPIHPRDKDYVKEGRKLVDKLVRRPEPTKPPGVWGDLQSVGYMLGTGTELARQEEKPQELIPPEMKLTPGERSVVASIEEKLSKPMFASFSRFLYIAKRDAYFSPAKALAFGFYSQLQTNDMNSLVPLFTSKVHTILFWFLDKRRRFLKTRRMFRNYLLRVPPFFPRSGGTFLLNIEEMATIFHFPGRITTPAAVVPRIESKKGEAPSGLPTE